jgi:hydroxyacylglutathione hydrolase
VPQPARLSAEALVQAARQRETVVVDTRRDRLAFMRGHLRGALFAPLDRTFATVLGSLARPEDSLVLLVAPESIETAVRLCIRIGFDRIAGWAPPESLATLPPDTLDALPTIDFRALASTAGLQVVDVRSASEFADGHMADALNIPHTRLLARLGELGRARPLAVHCLSGARAASAASALAREGFEVVYVNDQWPSRVTRDEGRVTSDT